MTRPRGDVVFAALCLVGIAIGAGIVRWGFSRAFPEASIDFRVTAEGAKGIAARALESRGFDLSGYRSLVLFDADEEAKTYLERTLGLARANREYGARVPVWRWAVRFVKPLAKLEYAVAVAPTGEVIGYRRTLPEKAAASDPGDAAARRIAEEAFRGFFHMDPTDRSRLRFVEATAENRPARVDRTYVFESEEIRHGDGALRYVVEVQGDRAGRCSALYHVPEKWSEEYRLLRSKNRAAGAVATLGLFLTGLAVLAVFLERVRRHDIRWGTAMAFGGAGFVLQLLASLNELPVAFFDYRTSESWGDMVTREVLSGFGGAVTLGVVLVLLVAAGEPLYRESCPDRPALGRIFSLRALGTRPMFRGLLLGYLLTAFFFAYQVLFYVGADRLGAWAPADVPYSNLLGTRYPWLAVLLMGFLPATTEEFSSRMFSIPFLGRFVPRWAAVVIPAFIWGFAHSAYPNQPFWIRGVEVGLAGIVIGVVFLKAGIFPLLVWHFTVDAVYTSLILIRSSNRYFVASGAVAAGVLLLPLLASALFALKRRGFAPDEELLNRSVGSAPPPPAREEASLAPPPIPRGWKAVGLAALAAVLALLLCRFALPRLDYGKGDEFKLSRGDARRLADGFVRSAGDDPARYVSAPFTASALPSLDSPQETGSGLIPYAYSDEAERWLLERGGTPLLSRWAFGILPGRVWQVRYLRFGDRHGWWVVLDGRNGKAVSFRRAFPEEEPGERPDEVSARAMGARVLRSFGLDPASYSVVSVKSEERKSRRDYRIVYESLQEAAGEARRRVTVEMAGSSPALLATALKLPEEWVRERERTRPATYVALAWKVGAIGTLLGLVVVELLRLARSGVLAWRRAAAGAAFLTVPSLAGIAVSFPEVLRAADPGGMTLATFSIASGVAFVLRMSLVFAGAFLVLLLVLAVRPDSISPRSWHPTGARAAAVTGAALLVLLAGRSLGASTTAALPLWIGLGSFPDPPSIDTLLPAVDVVAGAFRFPVVLGGAAVVASLLLRRYFTSPLSRAVSAVVLLGLFAPLTPHDGGELLAHLLASLLPGIALLGAAYLLGDDPRAFWLTGLLWGLLPAGVKLASSGVTAWIWNGVLVLAIAVAIVAVASRGGPARQSASVSP